MNLALWLIAALRLLSWIVETLMHRLDKAGSLDALERARIETLIFRAHQLEHFAEKFGCRSHDRTEECQLPDETGFRSFDDLQPRPVGSWLSVWWHDFWAWFKRPA